MTNTIVFSPGTNCKPSGPALASPPAIRLCCHTVWSFHNSQSQQEKSHFISKIDCSSNPALTISLHHSSMSISGTSLRNLSQYSFHTYESTQMANYASDCTELLCVIRDGSKFLSWEKVRSDSIRLADLWAWGGQLVCPLSVHAVLWHRRFTSHSHHECKQGIRRRWEVQGEKRWCTAARSTREGLGARGGNGCQPRGSEGELSVRPGLLQSRGRGKHNFSLCNSSGLAQLLAKYFRSREEKNPPWEKGGSIIIYINKTAEE